MDENRTILEQANEAIRSGDHEGFLDRCTEDTTWTFIGDETLTGKQAVREYMARVYTTPPEFDVSEMVAEGDVVVAIGTIVVDDGTGTGERQSYCDVWRFRDGLMAELRAFVVPPSAPS